MPTPKIILDTDVDTDCDDTGALAILHNLASAERAEILGIVCSIPLQACANYIACVNAAYGRPELPTGLIDESLWSGKASYKPYLEHRKHMGEKGTLYNEAVPADEAPAASSEDAVALYRRLLAAQPERSVTICAIGTLTAIDALLSSPPDSISPLGGQQLAAQKVDRLVCMAIAHYPTGKDGFNWRMDSGAAARVIAKWPGPIYAQPTGTEVLTGRRFMQSVSADNPIRRAYQLWLRGMEFEQRSSWDQLTVIYSLLGEQDLFSTKGPLGLSLDPESKEHRWSESPGKHPRYLIQAKASEARLAEAVEDLMIGSGAESAQKTLGAASYRKKRASP